MTPPELDFCAQCHEHASFLYFQDEGWRSECCGAPPMSVEAPSYLEDV